VHIECMVQVTVSQVGHRGNIAWWECHTCKQRFTGAMRTGLAEAWWARVRDAAEESAERRCAAYNLGQSLYGDGKYGEAERMFREVHGIRMRLLGVEHPETLKCAGEIALCLLYQGKYAKAEQINLRPEHPQTLNCAGEIASCLSGQGKYAKAEQIHPCTVLYRACTTLVPGCTTLVPCVYHVVPCLYHVVPTLYRVVPCLYRVVPCLYRGWATLLQFRWRARGNHTRTRARTHTALQGAPIRRIRPWHSVLVWA
jgi:hypothetical protein